MISNIALSLLLIESMREMGIALATAISAWINALLLYVMLSLRNNIKFDSLLISNSIKILISSIVLVLGIYGLKVIIFEDFVSNSILLNSLFLLLTIFLTIIIYLGLVIMLKVLTINQLRQYLKK